ncbi:MAG: hypothetical protein IH614_11580 [Desulfuromonadales bacterium]|nr:hypothetical protein [Desulfuromonadales bacterium]
MDQVCCAVCGRRRPRERMIRRQLNGQERFCCSLPCEVRWEKKNLIGVCG